jgi:predicted regulator of Ras-like GTPase activity (Roadblock/LC7/MglB family)
MLKNQLQHLFSLEGVRMAIVIDPEGRVADEMGASNIRGEQLAAVVSFVIAESRAMATRLGQEQISMVFVEFRELALISVPLRNGYFLVVITEIGANIGQVSYEMKKHQDIISSFL